ncbi:hypothetical protein [Pedobacter sp. L105]|nr:hypothetical protein [Pedobacter sp. L105]
MSVNLNVYTISEYITDQQIYEAVVNYHSKPVPSADETIKTDKP